MRYPIPRLESGHSSSVWATKPKQVARDITNKTLRRKQRLKKFQSEHDPLKLTRWFSDEMRFGLHTAHKRQWTSVRSGQPNSVMTLAISTSRPEPLRGELIAAFLPDMTPESHQAFLDLVADEVETGIALYQDQAGTHRAEDIISASHVHIRDIPPYSPELNPCERFFEELRKTIANTVFSSLAEIEAVLTDALRHYWDNPRLLTRLTAYSWIRKAPKYS